MKIALLLWLILCLDGASASVVTPVVDDFTHRARAVIEALPEHGSIATLLTENDILILSHSLSGLTLTSKPQAFASDELEATLVNSKSLQSIDIGENRWMSAKQEGDYALEGLVLHDLLYVNGYPDANYELSYQIDQAIRQEWKLFTDDLLLYLSELRLHVRRHFSPKGWRNEVVRVALDEMKSVPEYKKCVERNSWINCVKLRLKITARVKKQLREADLQSAVLAATAEFENHRKRLIQDHRIRWAQFAQETIQKAYEHYDHVAAAESDWFMGPRQDWWVKLQCKDVHGVGARYECKQNAQFAYFTNENAIKVMNQGYDSVAAKTLEAEQRIQAQTNPVTF